MKAKLFLILVFTFVLTSVSVYADSVFNHNVSAKYVAENLPAFSDSSCKFTQEKSMRNNSTGEIKLKSGGNFKFEKDKGVTFETLYPVKSVSSYTSAQNKQVSSIIKAIANKNYTYLERNFDIYFQKNNAKVWELALKPKKDNKASAQLKSITIKGQRVIEYMVIDTLNSKTSIHYTDCK